MPTLAACPSVEELQRFLLGRLPENQSGSFEAHLARCEPCVKAMETLRPHDTLVEAVIGQSSLSEDTSVSSAIIDRVLQQVTVGDGTRAERRSDPTPVTDSDELSLDFLLPPQQPEELGRLDGYRVLKVLGAGGMGVVFQAEDIHLKRRVALKVMKPEAAGKPAARERFLREGQAAAALEHEHVVTIFQVGEANGVPFLAMQWLKGMSLDERLKESAMLGIPEVLHLGRQIARGLAAAHECGLVHRDIKPSNLWLESASGGSHAPAKGELGDTKHRGVATPRSPGRIKILDFGLARVLSDEVNLTQSGAIVGTPAYMAPEQARGKKVDRRCDLFSLGVVLYRMATGQLPFRGTDTMAILTSLAVDTPTPPQLVNFAVPSALSDLIMQLLTKDPAGRPASAAEVANRLEAMERESTAVLDSPFADLAGPTVPVPAQPKIARKPAPARQRPRRRILAIAVSFFALAALAAAVVIYWETRQGTIRIEINDPSIEVTFDQTGPTIKGAEKESIKLKPGDHGIHVKRGDFEFDTDKFVLKKGETISLKVELLPGTIKVVQGDRTIGEKELPTAQAEQKAAEWVFAMGGTIRVRAEDEEREFNAYGERPKGSFVVTVVRLARNPKVGDAQLNHLEKLAGLKELDLTGTRVTATGVAALQKALPKCKIVWDGSDNSDRMAAEWVLSIGGVVKLNGKQNDIKAAGDLPQEPFELNLVYLGNNATSLKGAQLARLKDCKNLRWLDLSNTDVSAAGLFYLKNCKELTGLVLESTDLSDSVIAPLKDCKNLTQLYLNYTHVSDAGLENLKGLTNLTHLDLHKTKVTAAGVATLQKALPKCKIVWDGSDSPDRKAAEWVLSIGGTIKIHENGKEREIKTNADLPKGAFELTLVLLGDNPKLTNPTLARLKDCHNLSWLDLSETQISDASLADLKDCKKLTALVLDRTPVTDAGLAHLKECKNLTQLYLVKSKVTAAGVDELKKALPKCEIEWVFPDRKAAEWVLAIGGRVMVRMEDGVHGEWVSKDDKNDLPSDDWYLTFIELQDNQKVTDGGLTRFKKLTHLENLWLQNTQISDLGLKELYGLTKLGAIDLKGTKVTAAGVAALQKALPNCKVVSDGSETPDSKAAKWVLSIRGKVTIRVGDNEQVFAAAKDLPADEWKLVSVDLLDNKQVTDAGLVQLKALPSLTTLDLNNTRVTDAGLADFSSLPKLSELKLLGTRISRKGFATLKAALPGVRIAWSEPNRTAAEAVLALGGRVQLRHKNQVVKKADELPEEYFRIARVSLAGVKKPNGEVLPKMAALTDPDFDAFRTLDLSDSIAGNSDVPNLNRLTSVEELVLTRTKIDDLGLANLKLSQLKKLSLAGCGITDAGLKNLEKLTELKELDLTGTKVTKEGVAALEKKLPKCKIAWEDPKK